MKSNKIQLGFIAIGVFFFASILFSCTDDNNDFVPIPVILDFAPDAITLGDTINLIGGNFKQNISENEVNFSSALNGTSYTIDAVAKVLEAQTNVLTVIVPINAISGPVTVTAGGKTGTSNILNIDVPNLTITSINPPAANRGDTVTLSGVDFGDTIDDNTVLFGTEAATIVSASSTEIEVIVPESLSVGPLTVTLTVASINQETTIDFEVTDIVSVTVTSYNPPAESVGAEITIFGTNFSEITSENEVSFNGTNATVTAATSNALTVIVPDGATTGPISVTIDGETAVGPDFTILFGFTELLTIPGVDTSADFTRVFWVDNSVVYITGEDGILIKSTDAGATWTSITTPLTENLYDSFWINEMTGWLAQSDGTIHSTTDGGSSWNSWVDVGGIANGVAIGAFSFVDANTGWASGDNGIILKTTDGGASWSLQAAGLYNSVDFDNIYFMDENKGWAVGELGTIISTTDGGNTWIDQTITELQTAGTDLKRITFSDAMNGWLAGEDLEIYNTTDGGATWNPVAISGTYSDDLNDLVIVNDQLIIAVGDDGGIVRSVDGGVSFTASVSSFTDENFDGVGASPDGTKVIAVSDLATILR
ncbi:YCF48-related protein [Flavivirga aquimarina]|uniref:YCF48-related protein n=1 Tax=Flavivirga aquimarina TaxID=2027862 RepID=A0ABT8W583_9FLAO|nr:YCF48-related protein [Flavivirga aquimarina]MDO5968268.1 YCF48-related protein [Flavivirga aquimarina]